MAEALILKSGGGITSDEVTASRAQVLEGYTAVTNDSGDEVAQGTMPNRQAVSVTLKAGDVYAVPAGYHNGNGRVTANNLTVQTPGDATAANITSGRKAWVNGVQIVGNGADNTTFYNNGIAYADSRINNASASYTSGYTNGVATADSRVNPSSESYKSGYSYGQTSRNMSIHIKLNWSRGGAPNGSSVYFSGGGTSETTFNVANYQNAYLSNITGVNTRGEEGNTKIYVNDTLIYGIHSDEPKNKTYNLSLANINSLEIKVEGGGNMPGNSYHEGYGEFDLSLT